jgi:hypothetical protein
VNTWKVISKCPKTTSNNKSAEIIHPLRLSSSEEKLSLLKFWNHYFIVILEKYFMK